jgi:hypothetical protein
MTQKKSNKKKSSRGKILFYLFVKYSIELIIIDKKKKKIVVEEDTDIGMEVSTPKFEEMSEGKSSTGKNSIFIYKRFFFLFF